jgi:hypothetical protein
MQLIHAVCDPIACNRLVTQPFEHRKPKILGTTDAFALLIVPCSKPLRFHNRNLVPPYGEDDPGASGGRKLREVPMTFSSINEYLDVFEPLVRVGPFSRSVILLAVQTTPIITACV